MGKENKTAENGLLTRKLVHLALPVRWSVAGQDGRGAEVACTYDIHPNGARLVGSRPVNVGDLVLVERGRNKAMCQVVWAADPSSPLRGQFSVQCIEGRTPWEDELRQIEERYQPIILDRLQANKSSSFSRADVNRRRRPRFYVEGEAEVTDGALRVAGEVQQISEYGARLAAMEPLRPGTEFRLMLNVFDVSLALKAQVKYLAGEVGMGVEFHQIRLGDRPMLDYVLNKVRSKKVEDYVRLDVVNEAAPAV